LLMFYGKWRFLDLSDEKEILAEAVRELRKLKEGLDELRLLRFAANSIRRLRKRILSSRYD